MATIVMSVSERRCMAPPGLELVTSQDDRPQVAGEVAAAHQAQDGGCL
jgi:hypothetical protein